MPQQGAKQMLEKKLLLLNLGDPLLLGLICLIGDPCKNYSGDPLLWEHNCVFKENNSIDINISII